MSEKKIKKGILVLAGLILAVFLIGSSKGGRFSDWPILGSFFDQNLFPSKVKVGPPENESQEEGESQEKGDSDKQKNREDSDSKSKDYAQYEPRMFIGKWVRTECDNKDSIALPGEKEATHSGSAASGEEKSSSQTETDTERTDKKEINTEFTDKEKTNTKPTDREEANTKPTDKEGADSGPAKVESLPEEMVFVEDVHAIDDPANYKKMNWSVYGDYYPMRASFRHIDGENADGKKADRENTVGKSTNAEKGDSRDLSAIFDIRGDTLALGLIGMDPNEKMYQREEREEEIQEVHYQISWKGPFLTLTYKDSTATYVPSAYEENPDFIVGRNYTLREPANPDMDFFSLIMAGEGKGNIGNVYGSNFPVTYEFANDYSFQITMDQGPVWTYKEYLQSDNSLTLRKGYVNLCYTSDYAFPDKRYTRKILDLSSESFECNGTCISDITGLEISKMIDAGFILSADPESMVDPGRITEEFQAIFNGIRIGIRACNVSNLKVPLKECYVCTSFYKMDDQDLRLHNSNYTTNNQITLSCHDSMEKILEMVDNAVMISKNQLALSTSLFSSYNETEINGREGQIIMDPIRTKMTFLNFDDQGLTSCTLIAPSIYYRDMQYNMQADIYTENSSGTTAWKGTANPPLTEKESATEQASGYDSAQAIRAGKAVEEKIAGEICQAFSDQFGDRIPLLELNEYGQIDQSGLDKADAAIYKESGTILIPWDLLFSYGNADLSDKGKDFIKELAPCLAGCLEKSAYRDFISDIELHSYTGLLDKETALTLSKERADTAADYAKESLVSSGLYPKADEIPYTIKGKGYGASNYLSLSYLTGLGGPFIEIHCNLKPVQNPDDIDDIFKEQALNPTPQDRENTYMDPDKNSYNNTAQAFVQEYQGIYSKDSYRIPGLDLEWTLPKDWHFASDAELEVLNGGKASDLLNRQASLYVMAAYSQDYRSMAHVRLYPGQNIDEKDEESIKEMIEAMHRSLRLQLDQYAKDLKDQLKTEEEKDGKKYVSEFTYKDGDKTYKKKVSYQMKKDVLGLVTEIIKK